MQYENFEWNLWHEVRLSLNIYNSNFEMKNVFTQWQDIKTFYLDSRYVYCVELHKAQFSKSDNNKIMYANYENRIELLFALTWKAFQTKYYEGCSKFVIKKLTLFHELFAIQILNPLMCTRMQGEFLWMVFPFFTFFRHLCLYFFVKKRTENYPQLIFILDK